jgi:dihydroorotate dehydrogenase electron transfer subunit
VHAKSLQLPTAVRILDVRQDNYRTRTFTLDLSLEAQPGQFVMAWLPRFDEKPFSLVDANPVTLMVTAVGPFSTLLHTRQPGDRIWLRGPFGTGFTVADGTTSSAAHVVLAGGGYGVAPLYWLAQAMGGRVARITTIIGARGAEDLLYRGRFEALHHAQSEYRLLVTTEDGSAGQPGRVTDALAPLLDGGPVASIYACGPHGMLAALESAARRTHVPCQLSWEAYMRCAIGICGACEHEGRVLCMDGPVLAAG